MREGICENPAREFPEAEEMPKKSPRQSAETAARKASSFASNQSCPVTGRGKDSGTLAQVRQWEGQKGDKSFEISSGDG